MKLKLKNTLAYTILGFLPLSFSLLFTPLYTQYLSPEDYGLLNLFTVISGLLVPFFGLGIDQAAGYLYWDYSKDKAQLSHFISTAILLLLSAGLILGIAGIFCGNWFVSTFFANGDKFNLWPYLVMALAYPLFMGLNRLFLNYYRNEEAIRNYALLNIGTLILLTAGSVGGVIIFKKGAEGAVEGRTIGFCIIVLMYTLFELGRRGVNFKKDMAVSLLKMGGPLFLSTLVSSVAYIGDRLIVERLSTLQALGIYGFSVTLASVIEITLSAIGNSLIPSIYKGFIENVEPGKDMKLQLFFFIYLLTAISVLFIALITPIEHLLISSRFHESLQYIPILCIAFLPRCIAQIYSLKFYKTKKTHIVLILSFTYLICIALLGIPFYYYWGLTGLSLSVLFTGYLNLLLTYLFSKKTDSFDFKLGRLILFCSLITLSVILVYLLPNFANNRALYYAIPLAIFILTSVILFRAECREVFGYISASLRSLTSS